MKLKKWLSILICVLLCAGACACGGQQAQVQDGEAGGAAAAEGAAKADGGSPAQAGGENALKVGFSFHAITNDVFITTSDYCKELGEKSNPRIEFIMTSADLDVSKQISDVKDLISQQPDVIIITPEDSAASDTMIQACRDAGIPVLIQNRPYNPDGQYKPDSFVGVDAQDQGYAAVKAMFDMMIEDGETALNLILISGPLSDENSVQRSAGVLQAIEEYADRGAKLVTELMTDWDPDWLVSNLPSAMRANPDTTCLYVASDYLLSATQSSLESTGQWIPRGQEGHIYISSTDVFREALTLIEQGYLDADSLFDVLGLCETIVDYTTRLAAGEECPEIYIKGPVYTRDNYQDPALQAKLYG